MTVYLVERGSDPPPGEATHWTVRAGDPAFAQKVEDVIGLYVDPPAARPGRTALARIISRSLQGQRR
jgi:hypothetical protein